MAELELFDSLLNCTTVEDLHAATVKIAKGMGFEYFLYGVRVNTSLVRPYQFIFSCYPKDWRAHYDKQGYENIDPTVHHCVKTVIPVIWNRRLYNTRPSFRLMGEAKEFGIVSGASFPVHGGHGETAMMSMATSRKSRESRKDIVANLGKSQLLACYLHEAVQRIVLSKEVLPLSKINLTDREKECLRWASEGKTSWEISNILRVSERTVIFHIQNASRKMGVSHRQHAVARAISLNLVVP